MGVSASAKRDCEQKPQSSAHPPDFALTSEHMSVESPKRSSRTRQARSTRASISARSVSSPSRSASSLEMREGTEREARAAPGRIRLADPERGQRHRCGYGERIWQGREPLADRALVDVPRARAHADQLRALVARQEHRVLDRPSFAELEVTGELSV